ncbi:hypothetical protein LO772_16340 [Yinghuangia sp. ASG 101]|uniref:hypothetical protein n=1 Tax=Yinghuangia sp. ASG 101 TaxID=2896848 RepID=UPI001E374A25|nr:hypothetical protein [Yinghuangia sp. ASG 101]UGQ14996.1 hypothetical protein LO772_16340 [Yinghuangia sp. ASG 101]
MTKEAPHEEELTARVAELERLYAEVRRLSGSVAALNTRHEARVRPWAWASMTPAEARKCWSELLSWMRQVLAVRFPAQFRVLRPCWYRHPDVVEGLGALYVAWVAAYAGPDASPARALEWLHRWLPGTVQEVTAALRQCDPQHLRLGDGMPPYQDQTVALWVAENYPDVAG